MTNANEKSDLYMKPYGIVLQIVAVSIAVAASCSCGDKEAGKKMDAADAVMWTQPDSALAALESIDTLSLKTRARRARYFLLYTMALDRNGVDTADLRIIQPAVQYYERYGSNDDKMKMYYYLGTVQYFAGDLESSIKSFIQAKGHSLGSDNQTFIGLITSAISDVYAQNNNYYKSIAYCKEACEHFSNARDTFRLWNTTGHLANYYSNVGDWTMADSLYVEFFSQPIRDSSIYARQLLNLAWNNIFKPGSDAHKSIDLFRKATEEYGIAPSINDYFVFPYASEIIGDHRTAKDIISQLETINVDSTIITVWKYRISKHCADYKEALRYLEQSINDRDSEVLKTVGQSVALAQSDYYESKSLSLDKDRRIQRQMRWMVSIIALIVVASVMCIYFKRKKGWQRQLEEMSSINDEVNQRLNELLLCEAENLRSIASLKSANEIAERDIQTLSERVSSAAEKEQVLMGLRAKYVQANKRHYAQLNVLCRRYLDSSISSTGGKDKIYAEVKKILAILDEPNQKELESMLDDNLDGIMTKLRAAMPDATEKDFRFITFLILGFDAKTIARMMGYNVNTVYTKRYNIKERISRMDGENKILFSESIS